MVCQGKALTLNDLHPLTSLSRKSVSWNNLPIKNLPIEKLERT